MKILALVTIAVLCAAGAMAAPFTNGSFELPSLPADGRAEATLAAGWSSYASATCNPQLLRYTPPSTVVIPVGWQYGQMQVTALNAYAGDMQTFDAIPGYTYTIQGWIRPLAGTATMRVGVDTAGGTTRPSVWGVTRNGLIDGTAWYQFPAFQVTATGTSMTIFIDVESTTKTGIAGAFDGIMIPEPGSMVALLSGLVGLVAIRRRK